MQSWVSCLISLFSEVQCLNKAERSSILSYNTKHTGIITLLTENHVFRHKSSTLIPSAENTHKYPALSHSR